MKFQPVIKWTGSKRSQSEEIVSLFPNEIETFYEPFCGGASVARQLLCSDVKVRNIVCSDLNKGLIDLWNEIKNRPIIVYEYYSNLWNELNKDSDIERKRRFFESIRSLYNKTHNPLDFFFIMRTTTNGMPRYNKDGDFNNSFHITRNGIEPKRVKNILVEWSEAIKNVMFECCSFEKINPSKEDFVYLDPPYANTKGMYFCGFKNENLWNWLKEIKCNYALSYDGISGKSDNTYSVPTELYKRHLYLKSGNSSFKRVIGRDRNAIVYESLYLNY